ncbi:nickel-type superoxide dismutase maturation protease [Actinomadura sp. KC06]|uniref:nickel-type superoxide dismutase maturation protease n=1 Tax=Actinomadura sp. KC06 TaxID=2530369 RepID=UPI001053F7A5|nr:nickel-type superoxide dismutase maturation protease [Actinomadura sp. KC06]TDD39264.1 nickel-type superoxide dismutase maturation protease [Actinomadura sp. KC06]
MRIRALFLGLAGAAALAAAGARGRLRAVEVTGDSMLPGLRPGDWLLVRAGARPEAGDVVVARHPERRDLLIVKRAGHRAAGGWWLESDNQRAPGRRDSWDFGPVPDALIVGRVIARYWPRPAPLRPGPAALRPAFRKGNTGRPR